MRPRAQAAVPTLLGTVGATAAAAAGGGAGSRVAAAGGGDGGAAGGALKGGVRFADPLGGCTQEELSRALAACSARMAGGGGGRGRGRGDGVAGGRGGTRAEAPPGVACLRQLLQLALSKVRMWGEPGAVLALSQGRWRLFLCQPGTAECAMVAVVGPVRWWWWWSSSLRRFVTRCHGAAARSRQRITNPSFADAGDQGGAGALGAASGRAAAEAARGRRRMPHAGRRPAAPARLHARLVRLRAKLQE